MRKVVCQSNDIPVSLPPHMLS